MFDVVTVWYKDMDACKLVGSFVSSKLKKYFKNKNIGLYRDVGLGTSQNMSKPKIEKKLKEIIKVFKEVVLSITKIYKLQIEDSFDFTFNLFINHRKNQIPSSF